MSHTKRCLLLKYGELILKGANRSFFESTLIKQIRRRLDGIGAFTVSVAQSTVFIRAADDALLDEALAAVRAVFGVAALSLAYQTEKDMERILELVKTKIVPQLAPYATFKADARRSDKAFPLKSPEIAELVGYTVLNALPPDSALKVDVRNPEVTVWVEIRDDGAYVHAGKEKGAGGMPYGTSGRALLLLSGGIDSPVAGYRMARRGAVIDAVHFESYPYTSERAKEKVVSLAKKLCVYTGEINLAVLSLTELQLALKKACREDCFTLLLRRSMMRLSNRVAQIRGCQVLVTGESLGQVASQTAEGLSVTDRATALPVLRPLIAFDKVDIMEKAREIGTYEISIQPHEDCCTVFLPKHPATRPAPEAIEASEALLGAERIAALEEEVLSTETLYIAAPVF